VESVVVILVIFEQSQILDQPHVQNLHPPHKTCKQFFYIYTFMNYETMLKNQTSHFVFVGP
jgi:hypothetical protein